MIYIDNMAALVYTKDPKYHGRTKLIDIRFHYIYDIVARGEVVLQRISTNRMVDDPLTKAIARDAFQTHSRGLGLSKL